MGPFQWLAQKMRDHPGVSTGAILGGAIGAALGPVGVIAGASLGAQIGDNLDQPAPDKGEKDK